MRTTISLSLAAAVLSVCAVLMLGWDENSNKRSLAAAASAPATGDAGQMKQYQTHWFDGNGEVCTYAITQSRYGELRTGETELVFVAEEIARSTRIKIESDKVPPAERVPVMKLNRVVKFQTGLYDYALMTTTMAAVGAEFGQHPMQAVKVSNTTQEWCGNFFGMFATDRDALRYTRHSYFESEGDTDNERIALPQSAWEYEDNLPIMIRELTGPWMRDGETRTMMLMPSFQHQRFTHTAHAFVNATITKEAGGRVTVGDSTWSATTAWTWKYSDASGAVQEKYMVDAAYPHRILSWASSDGSSGTLKAARRLPYWTKHDNASAPLRRAMGLKGE